LFDQESWTFTYLLGCLTKKQAVLVDPVDTQVGANKPYMPCT